mgnify:CR=1 FL=1
MFNNPRYLRNSHVCDLDIVKQVEDRYEKIILPLTHRIEVYDDLGIETEDSIDLRNELAEKMSNINIILSTGPIISN